MPSLTPSKFSLVCDGIEWTQWKSFSVKQSLDQAAHSFNMETTDMALDKIARWNVKGGSVVDVYIDGNLIFSGYVRKYGVNISAASHSITIEGASKGVDAAECSHLGPYFWKNTSPEAIITAVLNPYGITASFDKPMKAIGREGFKVEVEKPPFEIIKQLAERDGLTVIADTAGNFRLYDGSNAAYAGSIERGDYVEISADHDLSAAFSEIIVKGQQNSREKPTKANFQAKQRHETTVKNPMLVGSTRNPIDLRYRPALYVKNDEKDAAKAFAEFVKSRFTGDVITAAVTVKSHLNPRGKIWEAGQEVFLNEELLSVAQRLVVADVEFSLSDGGYKTALGLKIPNSYDPLGDPARGELRRLTGEFGAATAAVYT